MLFVQHFAYAHLITHVANVTALPDATLNSPEGGACNGTATYVLCRRNVCSILVKTEILPAVPAGANLGLGRLGSCLGR